MRRSGIYVQHGFLYYGEPVKGHVILDVLRNQRPVLFRYGPVIINREHGIGSQIGKPLLVDYVADEVTRYIGLEVSLYGQYGLDFFRLVSGHELAKLFLQ